MQVLFLFPFPINKLPQVGQENPIVPRQRCYHNCFCKYENPLIVGTDQVFLFPSPSLCQLIDLEKMDDNTARDRFNNAKNGVDELTKTKEEVL